MMTQLEVLSAHHYEIREHLIINLLLVTSQFDSEFQYSLMSIKGFIYAFKYFYIFQINYFLSIILCFKLRLVSVSKTIIILISIISSRYD